MSVKVRLPWPWLYKGFAAPPDPIDPMQPIWLSDWAFHYAKNSSPYRADERFGIGIYQVSQIIRAIESISEIELAESSAACIIHIFGAARLAGAEPGVLVDTFIRDRHEPFNAELVLINLTKAQQMFCYNQWAPKSSIRKSRFKKKELAEAIANIARHISRRNRPDDLAKGFGAAANVLLASAWKE